MPDLTISTHQLIELAPVLSAVEQLSPPPTAKGRYALAKASAKVGPAFQLYAEQEQKLVQRCAVKDKDGKVAFRPAGNGLQGFDLLPELRDEYNAEVKALKDEDVVLQGVRMITHAELGQCPITAAQERVLMECGLLDDVEPA